MNEKIIEQIKRIEGYSKLDRFISKKRRLLISNNGDIIIFNYTKTKNQNNRIGNFGCICDADTYKFIKTHSTGFYYAIVDIDGVMHYYKTELCNIIEGKNKGTESYDGRYLIRIPSYCAKSKSPCMPIYCGNSENFLFITHRVM